MTPFTYKMTTEKYQKVPKSSCTAWYPPLVLFWYSPWYFSGTRQKSTKLVLVRAVVLFGTFPSVLRILVKYQGILVKYRLGEGEHRVHFGTLPKFGTPLVHFGTLWYTLVPVWYFFGTFLVLFWYLWYSPRFILYTSNFDFEVPFSELSIAQAAPLTLHQLACCILELARTRYILNERFLIPDNYAESLDAEMADQVRPILERLLPPNYGRLSLSRALHCLQEAFAWVEAHGGVPGVSQP
ncbi:hypothetical protein PAPYR_8401 [Paratrimastix pyriformis]|uniref:Uncharacterized protein n=1 Tax=Paratrimastix pyriformis TaxID=342808 RepID=A0ABQ8UF98_9EUKA|nr:hypothetical protein PAPYR_8401 [Paratrimastix pyriformis]